ncbi:transglutaminase-like domain-containing protein [Paenibacillus sp. CAU 1782]
MRQGNRDIDGDNEADEPLALEGTWGYRAVTSLLLYGLLIEWLLPWTGAGQWALLHDPWPLVAVIGCFLVVGLFGLPVMAKACVNALLCLLCLTWLHKGEAQSVVNWLAGLPALLTDNVRQMLDNGVWAMGGELQTLLLLTGWAMLVPAVQALLWLRQTALGLLALTLAYLVALHVWLGMDVMGALLRSTAEGLLLASITALPRAKSRLGAGWLAAGWDRIQRLDKRWLAGAMFLTITIVGCGLLVSAGRDNSEEPANWTKEVGSRLTRTISAWGGEHTTPVAVRSTKASSLGSALTGYGFDDSRLGQPIQENDEPLFVGFSPIRAYWRGEAKTVYDGSGWSNVSGALSLHPVTDEALRGRGGEHYTNEVYSGDAGVQNGSGADSGDDGGQHSSLDGYGGVGVHYTGEEGSGNSGARYTGNDETSRNEDQGVLVAQTVVWNRPAAFMPLFASGLGAEAAELVASDPRRSLGSFLRNEDIDVIYAGTEGAKVERYTVVSRLPFADSQKLEVIEEAFAEQNRKSVSAGSFGETTRSASMEESDSQRGGRSHERAASSQTGETAETEMDADELERYLQLPESLPKRVEALAAEVAGGGLTSQYERVKAVERFLETSYAYTKTDSELPPQGSDFVDHFLFQQKSGYCVHFSSAMVVMLRSQGIPARWVKGFTPGEELEGYSPQQAGLETASTASGKAYQVRSSDAHAWVEVYFHGAGWVPFDPTPGMSGVGATAAAAALPGGGAALAAGPGAAGWGEMSMAHLANWFGATAKLVADATARAAAALAQEARSAVAAAAAAPAATAVAAGVAALALGAAGALAAQRKQVRLRLRLALALRRYGAAYAAQRDANAGGKPGLSASGSGAAGLSSTVASESGAGSKLVFNDSVTDADGVSQSLENGLPRLVGAGMSHALTEDVYRSVADIYAAEAGVPSRRLRKRQSRLILSVKARRTTRAAKAAKAVKAASAAERVTVCMAEVTAAVMALLENGGNDKTFRQRIHALEATIVEQERRIELRRLSAWSETAAFGRPGYTFDAPSPQELKRTCRMLLRKSGPASISARAADH